MGSENQQGRVFPSRGRILHLMKKIEYRNTGEGFNLNFLSGETRGGKVMGVFFQLLHRYRSPEPPEAP